MSTCNQWDLQTLGSTDYAPKISPVTAQVIQELVVQPYHL